MGMCGRIGSHPVASRVSCTAHCRHLVFLLLFLEHVYHGSTGVFLFERFKTRSFFLFGDRYGSRPHLHGLQGSRWLGVRPENGHSNDTTSARETPLLLTPFAHWTPHSRPPPNPICGTKRSEKFCHSIYKSPSVSLLRHSGFCIAGTKMGYGRFTLVLYSKLHIQRSRMVRAFCPRQAGFPWFSSLSRHCSYGLASVLYRGLWYIGQDCMLLIGGFLHCGRRCR